MIGFGCQSLLWFFMSTFASKELINFCKLFYVFNLLQPPIVCWLLVVSCSCYNCRIFCNVKACFSNLNDYKFKHLSPLSTCRDHSNFIEPRTSSTEAIVMPKILLIMVLCSNQSNRKTFNILMNGLKICRNTDIS